MGDEDEEENCGVKPKNEEGEDDEDIEIDPESFNFAGTKRSVTKPLSQTNSASNGLIPLDFLK